MTNRKPVRTRGKIQFSRYFQELKEGDFVAISRETGIQSGVRKRYQGITGVVEQKRGRAYIIRVKDGNKTKFLIIEPIHLKKIKQLNKNDKK